MNGTIVRGYRVLSKVYETGFHWGNDLLIPESVFENLSHIYSRLGMETPKENMKVAVHMMRNENPSRRLMHYTFDAKKASNANIVKIDSLCGYQENEIVLVSSLVMKRYGLEQGEMVAIHPVVPVPMSLSDL